MELCITCTYYRVESISIYSICICVYRCSIYYVENAYMRHTNVNTTPLNALHYALPIIRLYDTVPCRYTLYILHCTILCYTILCYTIQLYI